MQQPMKSISTTGLFSHAIDASYHLYQHDSNKSVDYYSYEGCNIKDFDNILEKSKAEIHEEEIDDNSTIGLFSDEDVHRNSSECFTPKFTLFLNCDWKKNLAKLKQSEFNFSMRNNSYQMKYEISRRMTYDIPALKLDA